MTNQDPLTPPPPPAPTTIGQALTQLVIKFLASRKWMFTSFALLAAVILFALGKVTREELKALWLWLGGATIVATGLEGVGPSSSSSSSTGSK